MLQPSLGNKKVERVSLAFEGCKNAPKIKARAKCLAVLKQFKAPPTPHETSSSSRCSMEAHPFLAKFGMLRMRAEVGTSGKMGCRGTDDNARCGGSHWATFADHMRAWSAQ